MPSQGGGSKGQVLSNEPLNSEEFLQFLIGQSIKMINTLKRQSKWAFYADEEYPPKESVLFAFFSLLTRLNQAMNAGEISASEALDPFLRVIHGDDIPASVTLTSLKMIYTILAHECFPLLGQNQEFFHYLVFFLTSCQFETSDQTCAELIIYEILRIFKLLLCLGHTSSQITDDMACGICQVVFSICLHPKLGELLKKVAEMEAVEILNLIFSRLEQLTCEQEEQQQGKEVSLRIGKRHSFDLEEMKKLLQSQSQSQQQQNSQENEHSSFGFPCIREILSYLGACLDDDVIDGFVSSSASNSIVNHSSLGVEKSLMEKNRIFSSFILRALLEENAHLIVKFPSCFQILEESICKRLILHTMEMESHAYLSNCTIILNVCFCAAPSKFAACIELYLSVLIERLSKPSSTSTSKVRQQEVQDVLLCSLYELLCHKHFPMFIFQRFDAFEGAPFLFDRIMRFLTNTSSLNNQFGSPPQNWMKLNILLVILLSLWKASLHPSNEFDENESFHLALHTRMLNQLSTKRQFLECAVKFNEKPQLGISLLKDLGIISSLEDYTGIAKFLFQEPALDKAKIGLFISKYPEYNKAILMEFMRLFDFSGKSLDQALRSVLSHFRLPGEAQQISNIMEAFASAYAPWAPQVFENKDAVYVLSFAIIMLNTDLHNAKVKNKMSLQEFIRNNSTGNNGKDFCPDYLQQIYQNIKDQEITFPHDDLFGREYFCMQWEKVHQQPKQEQNQEQQQKQASSSSSAFTMSLDPKCNHSLLLLYLDSIVDFIFHMLRLPASLSSSSQSSSSSSQAFDDSRQMLWILFSFCKHFKDFSSFENVLASLIAHVNASEFDGKDGRFVELLHFLIVVLNQNITLLHLQGWNFLFDLLEKLFINNLLPKQSLLSQIGSGGVGGRQVLVSLNANNSFLINGQGGKCENQSSQDSSSSPLARSGGNKRVSILSTLTNILTRSSSSLPRDDANENKTVTSSASSTTSAAFKTVHLSDDWKGFVATLEREGLLFEFIKSSCDVSIETLQLVLQTIAKDKLANPTNSLMLFVEIYSGICLENLLRIDRIFPAYFATMTSVIDNREEDAFGARERVFVGMLRLVEELVCVCGSENESENEAVSENGIRTHNNSTNTNANSSACTQIETCLLYLQGALKNPNLSQFSPLIFSGLLGICKAFCRYRLASKALWSVLYDLVGIAAASPTLESWATECLLVFLEEAEVFFDFELMFGLLQKFSMDNANVYHGLFAVLLQVLAQKPSERESSIDSCTQTPEQAIDSCTQNSEQAKNTNSSYQCTEHVFQVLSYLAKALKLPHAQQIAMTSLQRAFLHSDLIVIMQSHVQRLFDEILFPCMVECTDSEIRQRLLGLATKAFLHCLHTNIFTPQNPDASGCFHGIWANLLEMFSHYYGTCEEADGLLREAVREYFKNVISVLLNLNVLSTEQRDDSMWMIPTWKAIRMILPAFYYEHFPQEQQHGGGDSMMAMANGQADNSCLQNASPSVPKIQLASEEIYL